MKEKPPASVLVVDDERDLADLFTGWLDDTYTVYSAYRGQEALDILDDTIDVVLLDRSMPGLTGDAVLTEIRARDLPCRVALVTAHEPDVNVVKLGFDEYITKPVTKERLHDVVKTLLTRKEHDTLLQSYFQLASKLATLECHLGNDASTHPEYQALRTKIDALENDVANLQDTFDEGDFISQLSRLDQPPESNSRDFSMEADS